jgi:hypothetical protein
MRPVSGMWVARSRRVPPPADPMNVRHLSHLLALALPLALGAGSACACGSCASLVDARIHDLGLVRHLTLVLAPVLPMLLIAAAVHHAPSLPSMPWRKAQR